MGYQWESNGISSDSIHEFLLDQFHQRPCNVTGTDTAVLNILCCLTYGPMLRTDHIMAHSPHGYPLSHVENWSQPAILLENSRDTVRLRRHFVVSVCGFQPPETQM